MKKLILTTLAALTVFAVSAQQGVYYEIVSGTSVSQESGEWRPWIDVEGKFSLRSGTITLKIPSAGISIQREVKLTEPTTTADNGITYIGFVDSQGVQYYFVQLTDGSYQLWVASSGGRSKFKLVEIKSGKLL